jgi:hypothetical protein
MDWLTFASKVIESVSWPVAAVALVLLLRDEIAKLAPFLKKFKAGPLEAEFERDVKELKEIKESTPQLAKPADAQAVDTASKNFLFQLAELHPRSAILESWVRVEAAARAVLARKNKTFLRSCCSACRATRATGSSQPRTGHAVSRTSPSS